MAEVEKAALADATGNAARRNLPPPAQRALAEAEERRKRQLAEAGKDSTRPRELGGRAGPDPVRYGDWENNGIISDF